MEVKFYESIEDSLLKFAVIIARSEGKWVFCKHKMRDTYECPGGHRETILQQASADTVWESIDETAARELREETGAIDFDITPLCVYSVTGKTRVNATGEESFGMLYYADIRSFDKELHSEMEKIILSDRLPAKWTYPLIQPLLIAEYLRRNMVRLQFVHTDGSDKAFISLCHALDGFLNELVGGEENRAEYVPYNAPDDIHDAIVIYDGDCPIGCAGFKKYDDTCAEVKRVFIRQEYRGLGISHRLMSLLEAAAKKQGYRYFILESGAPLIAAMSLYTKSGYETIPNYGPYKDMKESICMKKAL